MLYTLCVAALVASASAFSAPVASRAVPARASATMQMTDFSWRQTFNGKPPGDFAEAPWSMGKVVPTGGAASAAASGEMTVAQACIFMAEAPEVSFADKKAYLLEKGVSEFVITEAACTATDTTLVL